MRVCVAALRHSLHWYNVPTSCIQDAFFSLVARWFRERGVRPTFWNVSWSPQRPRTEDAAIQCTDILFIFSNSEFLYGSGEIPPMMEQASNARLARIRPLLRDKRVVVFEMDAHDTHEKLAASLGETASLDFISEADFPLTVQTLRYNQLRRFRQTMPRDLDFIYWGTTKRSHGDERYELVRTVLREPSVRSYLIGNHFGSAKADERYEWDLSRLAPTFSRARATWCFQWPGHGDRLTARYHEAMAYGVIPFVHTGYDTENTIALPYQRKASAEEFIATLHELRDGYAEMWETVRSRYEALCPTDAQQYERLCALLRFL